jgi:hypothetical protein
VIFKLFRKKPTKNTIKQGFLSMLLGVGMGPAKARRANCMQRAALKALKAFIPCLLLAIAPARAQNADASAAVAAQAPVIVQPQHVELTSSFDADSLGDRSANIEATFAPFGNDASGVRFRATSDADWYRFLASEDPRIIGQGQDIQGGLLAGYGLALPRFSVTGLVGPAFGEIVNQGVRTDRWGVQAVVETYATPTDWIMASASVSYSTIANYLQVQTKAGVKIFGSAYFGPEAKLSWQQIAPFQVNFFTPAVVTATPVTSQTSISMMHLGAHLSALSVGPVAIAISGGWAHSQQLGSGYYGSASLYVPF